MKIVLATDGSENAASAARFIANLPQAENFQITLLFVIQMPELHHVLTNVQFKQDFRERCRKRAAEAFHAVRQLLTDANIEIDEAILEGHPGKTIVQEAAKRQADLIVVGALGESLVDRILLGSTSDFVTTHAESSVLVVRPKLTNPTRLKFLVAYDGSDEAESALSQLAHSGWVAADSEVDLVRVVSIPGTVLTVEDLATIRPQVDSEAHESLSTIAENVAVANLKFSPHVVDSPHVGIGICDFALQHDSDVVVMGSTGKGLIARFLLGSVSRFVLHSAPCSVWIVRGKPSSNG